MMRNINTLNSKIFIMSALLATSLVSCAQASETSPLEETASYGASSSHTASSSSQDVQQVFIDTSNPAIKAATDQLLLDLTKGQQIVKEALRGALEKKLESNYRPIDTLKAQASAAGLDSDQIAEKAFDQFFTSTFQKDFITLYIKDSPLEKANTDYYGSRVHVSWSVRDTQHVHENFDELPLSKWIEKWIGAHNAMPFVQSRDRLVSNDFITGMYNASDVSLRGVSYLQGLYTFVSSKREVYKVMTFGK